MDSYVMECIARAKALHLHFAFMTPDYIATLAYNAHTAGDETQGNKLSKQIAAKEVALFAGLESSLHTASGLFLHKVRIEFVSMTNAISRCKNEYLDAIAEIREQYADKEAKANNRWFSRATSRTVFRLATITGFMATGAALARALIPIFSAETATHTGYTLPTLGAIGFFAWLGYAFTEWWNEHQRNRIGTAKWLRRKNARKEHDNERLHQIVRHLERLHAIWYDYTDIEYWIPVEASYARLIKDDMNTADQLDREFEQQTMSPMRLLLRVCLDRLRRLRKNDGELAVPAFLQKRDTV